MLADAAPAALFALASAAAMPADAGATAFLARASNAAVLADAGPATFLARASSATVFTFFLFGTAAVLAARTRGRGGVHAIWLRSRSAVYLDGNFLEIPESPQVDILLPCTHSVIRKTPCPAPLSDQRQ